MAENFSYEILRTIKVLSEESSGWVLELNEISWNARAPKFDIRAWSSDHKKMGKGVTLSKENLIALKDALNSLELD